MLVAAVSLGVPGATAHANTSCVAIGGLSCTFTCNADSTVYVHVLEGLPGAVGDASCTGAATCTVALGDRECYGEGSTAGHWHGGVCNSIGAIRVMCGAY